MRRLMLLRHAKTENDAPSGRDQDRRLDDRGRLVIARHNALVSEAGESTPIVVTPMATQLATF